MIIIIINNKKESPAVTPFICAGCTCIIYVHVGLSAYQKKALFITTGGLTDLTRLITVQCLHVLYFKLTFLFSLSNFFTAQINNYYEKI